MQTSFSGHETFPFRYGWLKKGIDAVANDARFFASDRAMIDLGVGKNMVKSIKYWCSATGVLMAKKTSDGRVEFFQTDLSERLLTDEGYDPYFEDPGSLWLMQWNIATNKELCATWFYLFNHCHGTEFTKQSLFEGLRKWLIKNGAVDFSDIALKRDIDCCVRTYVQSRSAKTQVLDESFDCPLTELNLISELTDRRTYQFHRGEQKSLPDEILLFCVIDFWERSGERANSLAIERLAYDPGSPGQVFKIDIDSLARRFENLKQGPRESFAYEESGGMKQVFKLDDRPAIHWVDQYFAS